LCNHAYIALVNGRIDMTIGAALAVIVVGVLIAVLLNATIGLIVAAIGVVGLILALFTTTRAGSRL
jgi:hypothetical protein